MALDSMRRGMVGGSALSLFIIKEFGLDRQALPTIKFLESYLEIEETLLADLPPFLSFLLTPFTDYHDSATTFMEILGILAELQRPRTCEYYWEKGDP